ncbi:hypothetical protein AB0M95_17950 [Sphaerisporangium sp. NPDC051017]|uniref:hypothetical protein n=1 Tax=Sphaerisporangium sp. NPDC051017 TaxID=3154636 RepID=UPI003431F010
MSVAMSISMVIVLVVIAVFIAVAGWTAIFAKKATQRKAAMGVLELFLSKLVELVRGRAL